MLGLIHCAGSRCYRGVGGDRRDQVSAARTATLTPMTTEICLNMTEAVLLKAPDRQACFADIKSLGVNTIRVELPWELAPTVGDATMADAAAAGLSVLAMVAHNPKPLPAAKTFGIFMGALAARYPAVIGWEIWNEPNLQLYWKKGNPEAFVPYQQAAYEAIKAVAPSVPVFSSGLAACESHSGFAFGPKWPFFASYTNVDPVEWLTRAYAAGIGGHMDGVAIHPYCLDTAFRSLSFAPTDQYVQDLAAFHGVMASHGDGGKDIWATEYGFRQPGFTPAAASTNFMAQTIYLRGLTTPVIAKAFAYSYRDNAGGAYGLLDKKNVRKPAYAALKAYL